LLAECSGVRVLPKTSSLAKSSFAADERARGHVVDARFDDVQLDCRHLLLPQAAQILRSVIEFWIAFRVNGKHNIATLSVVEFNKLLIMTISYSEYVVVPAIPKTPIAQFGVYIQSLTHYLCVYVFYSWR
jgi:hypothetical protein